MSETAPGTAAALAVDVMAPDALPGDVEEQLIALVARVFPDEPALQGTWYFQSRPDFVVVGRVGTRVVGLRPVVRRTVDIGGRPTRIAGGVIPTVDPDFRGRGFARRMTEVTLDAVTQRGDELSLAFLFDSAPGDFLTPWGFHLVDNGFIYTDPVTGRDVVETMRAFARPLGDRVGWDLLHDAANIHLGVGSW